jgi:hypothetical protein
MPVNRGYCLKNPQVDVANDLFCIFLCRKL